MVCVKGSVNRLGVLCFIQRLGKYAVYWAFASASATAQAKYAAHQEKVEFEHIAPALQEANACNVLRVSGLSYISTL